MILPTYFEDFTKRISLDLKELEELREAHNKLTTLLKGDKELKEIIVATFLQGSYKRSTIIKSVNGKKSDVDIVVVTKIGNDVPPIKALEHFVPFVRKHYRNNYDPQNRSIGLTDGNVELDLVVTSAPSHAQEGIIKSEQFLNSGSLEEVTKRLSFGEKREVIYNNFIEAFGRWQDEPLHIPDKKIGRWVPTHPIAQIKWTASKNRICNDYYIKVVKVIKWWHRNQNNMPKYPKGYPLEHIIGFCCPDDIGSVAEGIVRTFENIQDKFQNDVNNSQTPILKDHGVNNNVLRQIKPTEFKQFYDEILKAKELAQAAFAIQSNPLESLRLWKLLFGEEFDPTPGDSAQALGQFSKPSNTSEPRGGRFG